MTDDVDPRIEIAARAVCIARGLDPYETDWHDVAGRPVAKWCSFENFARDMIAVIDALSYPRAVFKHQREFTPEEMAELRRPGGFLETNSSPLAGSIEDITE